ncbi:glycosyltransferase family 4 protein [Candidatus Poribacteria bacterium]|nr:glycosyltransferase family 4 protein [Candidatus Poribacteria bacterium]MYA58454.1 glycosyltransferase family 4 protein [Candidatus Poribacteria bacterium]
MGIKPSSHLTEPQGKLKILMFNHEFPPIGGGGGWVSYFLGKHFAAAGHEVHLITSQFRECPTAEKMEGFHVHRVRALRKNRDVCAVHEMLTYAVSSSLYGLRFAKQFQPDIVQVFFGIPAGGGAYLLQKRRGVPYVVFLGGRDVPSRNPDPPYYRWLYLLLKPIIRAIWGNASAVVACSDGLRELARETDSVVKMDVIPDGLDLGRFEPVHRDACPEKVRVLTIGRLIPRKGFQFLIRALPQIIENAGTDDFEIEIVGDGPYQGELLKLSEDLGVASHIRFAGSVPYSELPQKYRDADVFILPSLAEGMPLVVLEAMGTGLPIVASRVQGIDELVVEGVNGALFDAGDVDGLAHSLVKLINAGEGRIEMGKASVERVKPYDWKHIADAYLALYDDILE